MTNSREYRCRRVLASLVPVKARSGSNDTPLTDYGAPSVLERNQTPDNANTLGQDINCVEVRPSQDISQAMDRELRQVQEQWLSHEQERFDIRLRSLQTPRPTSSNLQTKPVATYQTSLRQLEHIERLLHTAGDSLPTSLEAQDYLVVTQCYAMALEQLTTMTKALETRK